jgi:hypothetical protein
MALRIIGMSRIDVKHNQHEEQVYLKIFLRDYFFAAIARASTVSVYSLIAYLGAPALIMMGVVQTDRLRQSHREDSH